MLPIVILVSAALLVWILDKICFLFRPMGKDGHDQILYDGWFKQAVIENVANRRRYRLTVTDSELIMREIMSYSRDRIGAPGRVELNCPLKFVSVQYEKQSDWRLNSNVRVVYKTADDYFCIRLNLSKPYGFLAAIKSATSNA